MNFTERTFCQLPSTRQHRKCAEALRLFYHSQPLPTSQLLRDYNTFLDWMKLPPWNDFDPKILADRYHWHLKEAGLNLKEHNLLPVLRTGDREPTTPFLPIAIYLDHVRSAFNVGSILRTTEAFRLGEVHCCSQTPTVDNEKVQRTAMGTAELISCHANANLATLPQPIIVLDTAKNAIPLSQFIFPETFTLVLGNEEYGVSDEALSLATYVLEIPLQGAKNSLNIACAFAIAAAEIRNQQEVRHARNH